MTREFLNLKLLCATLTGRDATLNKDNSWKRPTNTTLKNLPPKFPWIKWFVGSEISKSVVMSSKTVFALSVFPPNFVLFLLICRSDVDLEHKRNIKRKYCSSSVFVLVIERYVWPPEAKFGFENHYAWPSIWALHLVVVVINLVNQNCESTIDINEKCCVTFSYLHYLGNSGNKSCTKKWPSS